MGSNNFGTVLGWYGSCMTGQFSEGTVFGGYIDVGGGCWRRNVLVTTMRCW